MFCILIYAEMTGVGTFYGFIKTQRKKTGG